MVFLLLVYIRSVCFLCAPKLCNLPEIVVTEFFLKINSISVGGISSGESIPKVRKNYLVHKYLYGHQH